MTSGRFVAEMQMFAGRGVCNPAMYIAGKADWGIYQKPGELETMQAKVCRQFTGAHMVSRAGHWVQQERPSEVLSLIKNFLNTVL